MAIFLLQHIMNTIKNYSQAQWPHAGANQLNRPHAWSIQHKSNWEITKGKIFRNSWLHL